MSTQMLLLILLCSIGNVPTASSERQLLAGYWGQNSAGPKMGPVNYEKKLKEVCQTTKYDILNVAFLYNVFDSRNKDSLPALDLAHHCTKEISEEYKFLLQCPEIEEGIKECQKLGKKVLISIGGPTGDGTLRSPPKAREFAQTLYDLFLGGNRLIGLRPFGSADMDGVNLDIQGGRPDHYPDFIRKLRRLMDASKKSYLITASPQCPYPDNFLRNALKKAWKYVDYVFVQFYNNDCHIGNLPKFREALDKWLSFAQANVRPLIFVGLPAHESASADPKYYTPPSELQVTYEKLKTRTSIGGIMLWDVSWDQNNIIDGRRYSDHVFALLNGTSILRPTTKPSPGQD
ncbi:hypothetical protein OS493_000224 [Desmophyllum pertusum]|uniref:GH18 domain-containing protein n=1 Tax=Desmophyllum pertusum TaxID=174260 RepID=A0A9X0A7I0_9CNID|nr:hypothetical protein OS493_000224 [Desmophyllum pertusum]